MILRVRTRKSVTPMPCFFWECEALAFCSEVQAADLHRIPLRVDVLVDVSVHARALILSHIKS